MGLLGQPSPSPGSSSTDIELAGIRTSKELEPDYSPHDLDYDRHSDDDDDVGGAGSHGDEGSRALLGSQERTRGRERIEWRDFKTIWAQVRNIVVESAPTLLFTTVGLLFTGKLLEEVSQWRAMREVDQLIMIIPVVLNLKGNIEMNLSARLSTAANVGELDDSSKRNKIIKGNLILLQVQAAAVSFVAACMALVLGLIIPPTSDESISSPLNGTDTVNATHVARSALSSYHSFILEPRRPLPTVPPDARVPRQSGPNTFIMIASTAMTAASLSGIFLGSFMCTLIVLCRRWGHDPDNIAPAVASCLGDLVTLSFMGLVSSVLITFKGTIIPLLMACLIIANATFCLVVTLRNPHVKGLLTQGWTPLFGAMIISCGTGIVLDLFVSKYEDFAILAVVISGLPGSVGAIFVSRLSTALHAAALSAGNLLSRSLPTHNGYESLDTSEQHHFLSHPDDNAKMRAEQHPEPSAKLVMITLLIITIPVEIIFLSILRLFGWLGAPFTFVVLSVLFFCCAVLVSFFIAYKLTNWLWSLDRDPDMYALPIHSAAMDLVGQLLLVFCFEVASVLGAKVRARS
ncbi:hypothetical protein AX16_008942 [Volvariella volvacea WC 439]|nr:hypothetical protein AX16_008942 [Volvariella volvacea WC 439]